uniref:H(+)-exporting diphosphatase n=1 Tax=Odontella aurita TaxID=265563 RepID=A0A7S4JJ10_9STRA|mmetsp:Transcript_47237/g.143032  ORF Transcript_47237/g.143032 Transcript_47237/m.143032 type:complete len:176 (+) Transcript_47237:185-712(+)
MSFRMDFYLWALLLLVQGPGTGAAFLPSSVVRQKQGFYASKPALDVAGPSSAGAREYSPVSLGMSELSDLPSILSSVETFDGSTVDPVVVSNVFWGALQGKIISVIIGQFLAAAVFAVLSSMAASQLAKIGEYVKDNIFKQSTRDAAGATVAQFASSVVDKGCVRMCIEVEGILS